ncbi:hypothetical protein ACSBR2_029782 [Camellia fascicularis]
MADDIPHDGAPLELLLVFPPIAEIEELVVAEPFDLATYHPYTHILPPKGIRCFSDFARGVPEDLLLRESDSHLSSSTTEGDSRAYRGYGMTTARDWYDELPVAVRDIIDEAGFGLFYSGLSRVIESRPLLGALVERW